MTLCSDNDHDLKSLLDHIKDEYHNDGKKNVGLLGTVLTKMRKFDDAERYFLRSIKKWLSNHQNTDSTYQNLGLMTYDKGNYDWSLEYYHKSLDIKTQIFGSDGSKIGNICHCMANTYSVKGDHRRALELYNKTMIIYKGDLGDDHNKVAQCLISIGFVYGKEKKHAEALECLQNALLIQQMLLPDNHSSLGHW
jgi:tetratricopeptide (TPR) repeat protein